MKQNVNIDPADYPLPGNRKSPKEQYQAIRDDEKMAARKDVRGSNIAAKMRLAEDAKVGRYANPEYAGDLGQFLMSAGNIEEEKPRRPMPKQFAKGGKIDGCAQRGKTKGRFV